MYKNFHGNPSNNCPDISLWIQKSQKFSYSGNHKCLGTIFYGNSSNFVTIFQSCQEQWANQPTLPSLHSEKYLCINSCMSVYFNKKKFHSCISVYLHFKLHYGTFVCACFCQFLFIDPLLYERILNNRKSSVYFYCRYTTFSFFNYGTKSG